MGQLMEYMQSYNHALNDILWGIPMLSLILFTGLFFTFRLRFFQFVNFRLWFRTTFLAIFRNRFIHHSDGSTISQFQAVSTALAATIGTGNIVGVATALTSGGPGALFWMWISAVFGMMTSYAENVLGIRYRYRNGNGQWMGGPMAYMQRGLGNRTLAIIFSVCCVLASLGMGNMAQANSISGAVQALFGFPKWLIAIFTAFLVGAVIMGGISRIGKVAERIVPFMAVGYILCALIVVVLNISTLPGVFTSIFRDAFSFRSLGGGVGGYVILRSMRYGFARGVFSNEAGLGSTVIAHSNSNIREPAEQGMWGIFEVFVDTIVMCTLTGLAIMLSGALGGGKQGVELAMDAFSVFGSWGNALVPWAVVFFAFCTLLGWCYFGERAVGYLLGERSVSSYRVLFMLLIAVGCMVQLEWVWEISDTFNAMMALPNIYAILLLSPEVVKVTKEYLRRK